MWTKVCTFETQTSIGITETQCRTKPEVKTCLTRFAMCKYPNRIQKNPHQTLRISKWGQSHTPKEPKYDWTPERSYMSQTIEDYSISSIVTIIYYYGIVTIIYYYGEYWRKTLQEIIIKALEIPSGINLTVLAWSSQTWMIIRHVNFRM